MRVCRAQVAENRTRILAASSELFREKGFESVTIADVMKAANLTHGGFYGYFSSKEDLISHTLMYIFENNEPKYGTVEEYVTRFLSAKHRDNPQTGCPFSSLGSEVAHQELPVRSTMSQGLQQYLASFAKLLDHTDPAKTQQAAIGLYSTLIGSLILSRMVDEPALSDQILTDTRNWITSTLEQE